MRRGSKTKLAEQLISADSDIEDKLAEFLKGNVEATEDDIEKWTEENDYDEDEVEKTLILFAVKFARFKKGGNSVHDDLKIEDVNARELKMGIEVEKEHSPDRETCVKIALDHLAELPDYYTRLKKMEGEAEANE